MRSLALRASIILALAAVLIPRAGDAVITFNQLEDDVFVVSHRVKIIGSRGQATRLVYEKAASLCVAAGFSQFKILQQESEAAQQDDAANATLRVQFFFDDGEGRIDCEKNANPEYVGQARTKLAKRGYQPPPRPDPEEQDPPAEDTGDDWSCTVEQIATMAKAGFSDQQIKAACPN